MAGSHWSLLTVLSFFLSHPSNHKSFEARSIQPTDFLWIISWCRLWEILNLCFVVYLSLTKGCMVLTRSMATSLGHQESGNASSHPNCTHQLAPVMQLPSIQQMQSIAAAMAELTHQNQELTREINQRRQRHERCVEGQA